MAFLTLKGVKIGISRNGKVAMRRLTKGVLLRFLELLQRYPGLKFVLLRILSFFPRTHERLRSLAVRVRMSARTKASGGGWLEPALTSDGRIDWGAYPKIVREIYEELRKNVT